MKIIGFSEPAFKFPIVSLGTQKKILRFTFMIVINTCTSSPLVENFRAHHWPVFLNRHSKIDTRIYYGAVYEITVTFSKITNNEIFILYNVWNIKTEIKFTQSLRYVSY